MSAAAPPISAQIDAPLDADVIFLPTDGHGTPGVLNRNILERLNLPMQLPRQPALAKGYSIQTTPKALLCHVVTVGSQSTAALLQGNLAKALADSRLAGARTLWLPLMGTGVGGLGFLESFQLTSHTLMQSALLREGRATAVISVPMEAAGSAIKLDPAPLAKPPPFSADPYQLRRSEGVTVALELATALATLRSNSPPMLSTTLLFFTLAGSQASIFPALRDDLSAQYFAAAVREFAGARYDLAWREYFDSDGPIPQAQRLPLINPTQNVSDILHKAKVLAGSAPEQKIEIDHLIAALLGHEETQLREVLAHMGVAPERLLSEYRDARLGQVATRFQNDVANDDDRLGYARYAIAIHAFLTHEDTAPPLSISIQAPWGAGKSTLMHLVREKLDPRAIRERYRLSPEALARLPRLLLGTVTRLLDRRADFSVRPDAIDSAAPLPADGIAADKRRWTVWFNAWKYETTEQIWSGLVDAIVSQVADRLPPIEREKFLLKLHLARIDDGVIRKRIYDRVVTIWWSKVRAWTLAGTAATLALFGLGAVRPALPGEIQQALALWSGNANGTGFASAIVAQIVLSIYLVGTYFVSRRATRAEPANFSLADVIRVPDYDKGVGEIHQIHADLRRVLSVVPSPGGKADRPPLVIFIDDLDRCSPGKVASVVEGVSMLLANNDYHCMFVIGMDPQMVAAALEKAHEEVRNKLPRYERAVPLGWRFMDKFVQLPFTIPPSGEREFGSYVEWLAGAVPAAAEQEPGQQPGNEHGVPFALGPFGHTVTVSKVTPAVDIPAPTLSDTTAIAFTESRDVGAIIRKIAAYSVGNPREMKRMVNLARFYLALRRVRRDTDRDWRAPALDQYARWIAVTLRWPDMLRWLQWGADEARWPPEELGRELVVRRLRTLESSAEKAETFTAWYEALKKELNVPVESDGDWARDSKLFEFFKAEGGLPAGTRLSDAAARGFW